MGGKWGLLQKSPQVFLMLTYGIERISTFSDAFFRGFSRRNIHTLIFTTALSLKHTKKNLVYWGKLHLVFLTKFNYWLKGSLSFPLFQEGLQHFFCLDSKRGNLEKQLGVTKKSTYLPHFEFSKSIVVVGYQKQVFGKKG